MNKKQLAGKVAGKSDLSKAEAERLIDTVLDEILNALQSGEKVRLVGFGNFVVRKRKGRVGRNPQTGAAITIGESKSPAFVPGINLKRSIKGLPAGR
ncbi:DNA-binding protein [candidate division WOR-1 bacterium RIFCSPHIGHO2_01_FULL_53_15]|uniref:DNA-binding protein n=1 Tax=candidate division WOR-1 bacterium RIFCSPHIGHO2_01_FULL_53_15 TaxID=1802564 RepID=A0A1F4Q4I3_UNCSA|nr:MAG: DNA-binding protein [candidate division WOR-1 bacterium RIFCSPHIGHO2_01_FULL_53_15]OGC13241.1 MAG: DNA-binding protein [candidate division WOR-1 bacterium RIFCSPHIGHO2_02_FULL_53_26]